MKRLTILLVFLAQVSIDLVAQTVDLYVGSSLDFYAKGIVTVEGNVTIANGQKFTSDATAKILVKGGITVTANPLVLAGAITFTNAAEKNISGSLQSKAIYMTASSALNLNGTGNLKATDSLTLNGVIKTNANEVELGTSASNVGKLVYTAGYIDGKLKRWFGATTVSDVLFPLGGSTYYAPAKITYATAPTAGGTLVGKHTMNSSNPLIATSLVDGSTTIDKVSEMNSWQFDAANGLTGGNYNMELTSNLIYGITDVTELRIVKRATASDPWELNGTHVAGSGTTTSPIIKRNAMSGFSQFAIGSSAVNPLPVTLTLLNAECVENGVEVKWQTASENNSDFYAIERSLDGQNWNEIATKLAAGNSSTVIDYSFVDEDRITGTRYYRLNQVDINGTSVFYGPVSTACLFNEMEVTLFPNPASSQFNLAVSSDTKGEISVQIVANDGKKIASFNSLIESGSSVIPVNISSAIAGVYQIITVLNGKSTIGKLVIL